MFEKHAYKQVSVEARDNSRNTTDVPTNVMFPACVNKKCYCKKGSNRGLPKQIGIKKKWYVKPWFTTTYIRGKDTYQSIPRHSQKKTPPVCIMEREIEVQVFGKTKGVTIFLACVANSFGFKYVLSVVSSSKCWSKRHRM